MPKNNCIGSPSNLEVLLHMHVSPSPHPRSDAPAVVEAIAELLEAGMICRDDRHYTTTDKGKFYIEHLLSIPFPVRTFSIPDMSKEG